MILKIEIKKPQCLIQIVKYYFVKKVNNQLKIKLLS